MEFIVFDVKMESNIFDVKMESIVIVIDSSAIGLTHWRVSLCMHPRIAYLGIIDGSRYHCEND